MPGAKPETIQGLVYREGKEIRDNGLRTDLVELDSLPFPAYHKLDGFPAHFEAALFNYPKAPTATIISSRGCPYQCSYCDRSVYRRSFRYNSAEYLYEHMAFLKKQFGIRHVFFYDDLFTFNRERVEKFCGLLREKPLGMTFNCAVRVGHADDELLRMLKAVRVLDGQPRHRVGRARRSWRGTRRRSISTRCERRSSGSRRQGSGPRGCS